MSHQTAFRHALLDAQIPIPQGLVDGGGLPAGRRYDVYRNNIATSLGEALEAGFPSLAALLGEANFKAVAGAYLRAHPPRSPLMMHYGAEMPDFIATVPPLAHLAYLPDVARLDLALRESYHAADHRPMPAGRLADLPEEALMRARLTLAPSLRLVRSDFPLLAIWQRAQGTAEGEMPADPQWVVVLRVAYDPVPMALHPSEARFLKALLQGETLGAALDAAKADNPAFDPTGVISILMQNNAICALKEGA